MPVAGNEARMEIPYPTISAWGFIPVTREASLGMQIMLRR